MGNIWSNVKSGFCDTHERLSRFCSNVKSAIFFAMSILTRLTI